MRRSLFFICATASAFVFGGAASASPERALYCLVTLAFHNTHTSSVEVVTRISSAVPGWFWKVQWDGRAEIKAGTTWTETISTDSKCGTKLNYKVFYNVTSGVANAFMYRTSATTIPWEL